MSTLARRERASDLAARFGWIDRMFEEWMRSVHEPTKIAISKG